MLSADRGLYGHTTVLSSRRLFLGIDAEGVIKIRRESVIFDNLSNMFNQPVPLVQVSD